MGIHKFKQFQVEAEVCGQVREVVWDDQNCKFTIVGIRSFMEVSEVLAALAGGNVALFDPTEVKPPNAMAMPEAEFKAHLKKRHGVDPGLGHEMGPQLDPPPTPVKAKVEDLKPAAESRAAPSVTGSAGGLTDNPTPAGGRAEPAPSDADMAVFGRMNKLSEIVEELRKRGFTTYEQIKGECDKMAATGDVCPAIDQLQATGKLEERLKTHLTGKGIAVPA